MLTRNFMFGLNLVSLVGFLVMGIGLTLNRQRMIATPAAFAMMGAGTALLFAGIYVATP